MGRTAVGARRTIERTSLPPLIFRLRADRGGTHASNNLGAQATTLLGLTALEQGIYVNRVQAAPAAGTAWRSISRGGAAALAGDLGHDECSTFAPGNELAGTRVRMAQFET